MMPERDYVLAVLAEAGEVPGRTMLQKLVFLLVRPLGDDSMFTPYFYGPYSTSVQQELNSLVAGGYVDETVTVWESWDPDQFDVHQYRYRLTETGVQLADTVPDAIRRHARYLVQTAKQHNAWSQAALAVAAKLAHLREIEPDVPTEELPAIARQFGWRLSASSAQSGAALLSNLPEPMR
jgi:uncharacterized protein YwgA